MIPIGDGGGKHDRRRSIHGGPNRRPADYESISAGPEWSDNEQQPRKVLKTQDPSPGSVHERPTKVHRTRNTHATCTTPRTRVQIPDGIWNLSCGRHARTPLRSVKLRCLWPP